MQVALIVGGLALFVVALLGFSALYDRVAQNEARSDFGGAAGVYIGQLRHSTVMQERLASTRWRRAMRVGINHGKFVLDESGLRWRPSFRTGRKVPAFDIAWSEIASFKVDREPKLIGRRVAYVHFELRDGTVLRFETVDPDTFSELLPRYLA